MPFLLIHRADRACFNQAQALVDMQSIGATRLMLGGMPGAAITGHYSSCSDSVIVELKSDGLSFAISDCGPAALEFAMRLQAVSAIPLRIIDEGYTFDLPLKKYSRTEELVAAIEAADV